MPHCVTDRCCFCVELRTASFIIGYLDATLRPVEIISTIYTLCQPSDPSGLATKVSNIVVVTSYVIATAILIGFNTVFLIGLHKRNLKYVRLALIYRYFYQVLIHCFFILSIALRIHNGGSDLAFSLLDILLWTYFVLVIRSYYFQMLAENSDLSNQNP